MGKSVEPRLYCTFSRVSRISRGATKYRLAQRILIGGIGNQRIGKKPREVASVTMSEHRVCIERSAFDLLLKSSW